MSCAKKSETCFIITGHQLAKYAILLYTNNFAYETLDDKASIHILNLIFISFDYKNASNFESRSN